MPTLKQIDCSIELGPSHVKLPEYGTLIRDGYIETFVALPDASIPFTIHIKSHGYVHTGLAFFVFIDGEYQCNRNRIELKAPGRGVTPKDYEVEFRLRQKEEMTAEGRFLAREWTFEKLDRVKADKAANARKSQYVENVGTIEVVLLRCQSDEQDPPPRLMPSQVREAEATPTMPKKQERKQQPKKEPPVREPVSEIGISGLFGLFDGACDNMNLDGPGDNQPRDLGDAGPPQTPQDMAWDSIMGEYTPVSQHIGHGGFDPSPEKPQQERPQYAGPHQFGGYCMPGGPQAQAVADQPGDRPGDQPEALHYGGARKIKFELGAAEETTPPKTSEPIELIKRFKAVLNGHSPYTQDEDGILQFREELDTYKTILRRFKKHNTEDYAIKIRNLPDIDQLETFLDSVRRELALDPEPAAESGPMRKIESQVLTDGALDEYKFGQPAPQTRVPNNYGWQEMGQGNANFGTQPQRQTFVQGPVQYSQPPVQLYVDNNGNPVQVVRPVGYQGFQTMPQGVPAANQHVTRHNQQPAVQFVTGGQFQGQGVGPQFGYAQGNMNRGGFQQHNWIQGKTADRRSKDPMDGDPWIPPEDCVLDENYVDSRYKDDGKWDEMCQEAYEERKREGKLDNYANGVNNKAFHDKVAQEERKKSESKTKSSHGWGAGDGDANQQTWAPDNGNGNGNADAAIAAWNDVDKKSSGRGVNVNKWDKKDNNANLGGWGNTTNPWDKNDDNGNTGGRMNNSNSKRSTHRLSHKRSNSKNAVADWNDQGNDNKNAARGWSDKSNDDAAGWQIQGGGNNNNGGGGWSNNNGSNKCGWDNASQTRTKTASQAEWSANVRQDTRPPRRTKDDVNSKAHIKPYFNDWNKPPADEDSPAYRKRDTPRDAYKYPALPRPAVPSNEAKDKSHGVQAGKGADYSHKCRRPVYVDSMEQPYAVFTFKYRSKKVMEKILNVKVNEVDFKKIQDEIEFQKLLRAPKDRIAAELARRRMSQDRQTAPASTTKKANDGWSNQGGGAANNRNWGGASNKSSSHRGGWDTSGQDAAPADDGWGHGSFKSPSNKGGWDGKCDLDGHGGATTDGEPKIQAANGAWKPDIGGGSKDRSPSNLGGWGTVGKRAAPANEGRGVEKDKAKPREVIKEGIYATMIWDGDNGPVEPARTKVTDVTSLFF